MIDEARIRKVKGGYIVHVRWPYAGSPIEGGEMVCTTFDEAVTALYWHLNEDHVAGVRCRVEMVSCQESKES